MFGLEIQTHVSANPLGDPDTAKYAAAGLVALLTLFSLIIVPMIKPEVSFASHY